MQLVVDIGNTRIKAARFNERTLEEEVIIANYSQFPALAKAWNCRQCIISSVGTSAEEVAKSLTAVCDVYILDAKIALPIINSYASPETLGPDRIAAAVGGWAQFKNKPVLIFDAGTCLTTEFVTSDGKYLGGAISPGVKMRLKAMHEFTARLPLAEFSENLPELTGTTTESCLQSGAINGFLAEIEGVILRYRQQYPDLQVILCGGDAKIFEKRVKPAIFVLPKLVLTGLNEILLHNAQ